MQLTIAHPQEVVLASTIKRFLKTKNTEYWAVRDHQIPRVKMLFFKAQTIVTSFHMETPSSTKQNICEHFSRTTVSNTSDSIKNGVPPEHSSEKHNVLLPVCQWFSFLLTYSFITIILLVLLPSLTASTDAPISFVQVKHSTFSLP